jgi:hypothetical protein
MWLMRPESNERPINSVISSPKAIYMCQSHRKMRKEEAYLELLLNRELVRA